MAQPPRGTPSAFSSPGAPAAPATPNAPATLNAPGAPVMPSQPIRFDTDPASWPQVPESVADKLRALRSERDAAQAIWRSLADQRRAAQDSKASAAQRLAALHSQFGNLIDQDHPEIRACERRLASAAKEIERLAALDGARAHQRQQIGQLVERVDDYFAQHLRQLKSIPLHQGPLPELRDETPLDCVQRIRFRLRELDADAHRIRSAPFHAADAKRRMRVEVQGLASRGAPNVEQMIESADAGVGWRERPITDALVANRLVTVEGQPAALPLLIWLHCDLLIEKLEAEIGSISDDGCALTLAERSERLALIAADRLSLEREEEHAYCAAVAAGASLLRRPDVDPRALLQLSSDLPPPPSSTR